MEKTEKDIEEERENVAEAVNQFLRSSITLDMIMSSKEDPLALTLRPLGYSLSQDSPVKEPSPRSSPGPQVTTTPTQSLTTTSPSVVFIANLFPSIPVRQETPPPSPPPSPPPPSSSPPPPSPPPPPSSPPPSSSSPPLLLQTGPRQTRNRPLVLPNGKTEVIPAPYVWATTQRAVVHSLDYLVSSQILIISGQVQCKRCERSFEMQYDLLEKFNEIGSFIAQNKSSMRDRAPDHWKSPTFPNCTYCGAENSVKPCISAKKRSINWLFLLLGQMIGCCTLEQLKYFCKHTKNHRTACKDRVLYLTYLGLCKQLDPTGPFSLR